MQWTPAPLIDPQLSLSRRERRAVYTGAWTRWLAKPTNTLVYTGGLIGALFVYLFVPDIIEPYLGGHRWWFSLVWLGVYAVGIYALFLVFHRFGFGPCVYAELRAQGHDVCPKCGYLLSGLDAPDPTCPECGVPVTDPPQEPGA